MRPRTDIQRRARPERNAARQRVLKACRELLEERRWTEIPLEDVMARADLSRTAFYRHFEDREQLLLALLEDLGISFDRVTGAWTDAADAPADALRKAVGQLVAIYVEHGRLMRAIADAASYDRDIDALYQGLGAEFAAAAAARIQDDLTAGRAHVASPDEIARALVWLNERYLTQTFGRRPFATSPETATRTLADIWVNTVYGEALTGGS